jgi:hypothetical protein
MAACAAARRQLGSTLLVREEIHQMSESAVSADGPVCPVDAIRAQIPGLRR